MLSANRCRYYILVGDDEAWRISLKYNLWGFSEKSKGSWNTSEVGDYIAFYATDPIKKVIGFGRITRKFIDDTKLWPDEKFVFKKAIWKYRFKFERIFVIDDWNAGIPVPTQLMLNVGRKVIDKEMFVKLIEEAELKWSQNLKDKLENINTSSS